MPPHLGKFIAFEALDGSGASTQISLLAKYLSEKGLRVHVTKEPTNNIIGGLIRGQLTKDWKTSQTCLQLLFAADRAHHLERDILPALQTGAVVITDRYCFSTMAFGGIDIDIEWLKKINEQFLLPDLVILLKVAPEECIARIKRSRMGLELFEDVEKLRAVWTNYEKLAKEFPNFVVVDGSRAIEEIAADIRKIVEDRLALESISKNINWYLK